MSISKKLLFEDYDNFSTEEDYTTSAEAQDYFRNMDEMVTALIDVGLWQPSTRYAKGAVVKSPSMPSGTEAICVAENGGTSSSVEPSWGSVGGDNVSDGTCFWQLRYTGTVVSVNGATPDRKGDVQISVATQIDEQRPIKTFTSLEQIGLTNSASEIDIAEKLPANSMLYWRVGAGSNPADFPNFSLKRDASIIVQKGIGTNDIDFTAISYLTNSVSFLKAVYTGWVNPKFAGWKKILTEADQILPTGTVIPYLGQNAPNGFLSCNGAGLRSTTYTGLFNVIGTAFGSGDGVNTDFNLPNLNNGSFLEGSDIVGVVKEAGLPNILGTYSAGGGVGASWLRDLTGAFTDTVMSGTNARSHSVTSGTGDLNVSFNASKSNAIYGASETVQPKSVTVKFCIKY